MNDIVGGTKSKQGKVLRPTGIYYCDSSLGALVSRKKIAEASRNVDTVICVGCVMFFFNSVNDFLARLEQKCSANLNSLLHLRIQSRSLNLEYLNFALILQPSENSCSTLFKNVCNNNLGKVELSKKNTLVQPQNPVRYI